MGLADTIAKAVGSAFAAVSDLKKTVTYYRSLGGQYDPDLGTLNTVTQTVSFGAIVSDAAEGGPGINAITGQAERRDGTPRLKAVFQQSDITFTPKVEDECLVAGQRYSVTRVYGDPAGATWTIWMVLKGSNT